ncbi:rhodanese-like domain-containing protein [Candidatus Steffania adelgidicola]|uniref:rhodanese-like domain-containing protein n=1 Tax=Candidatus Steffania adelgidicola TaxID=1076626 RepID=UPI001D001A7F|nr:rhodanese-like domain-containing protein [Candidatus Steffania adelgidicola]UDG79963.1 putative protein YibN [Candidatus Steffania adelgidicola]
MPEFISFIDNHLILSLGWIVLLSTLIFTTFQNRFSKIHIIERSEAIQLINKKEAVIVDLRNRKAYHKGHIVNSLNLSEEDIKSGNLGELQTAKSKPVILVCSSGSSSRNSAKYLIQAEFSLVYVLKKGIFGWNMENLPLIRS